MKHRDAAIAPAGDMTVIEAPHSDTLSFYQRNSGSLPKSAGGMGDVQRRSQLPSPTAPEPATFMEKIKGLVSR